MAVPLSATTAVAPPLPYSFSSQPSAELFDSGQVVITVGIGVLTLLGPNGSGKSQILRQLKSQLQGQLSGFGHTVMLAAGRLLPLESRRLRHSVPHGSIEGQPEESITLSEAYKPQWHVLESAQGILNRLERRSDLQIKVRERLRALFGRDIELGGDVGKIKVNFARDGAQYPSSQEASGLLHLVVLLAALYDDEIAAVLIDEPEISLHPQYQAFLRREMDRVAGDPAEGRKVVVVATHAPAMVRLRRPEDLADVVFFSDIDTVPVQVPPTEPVLQSPKVRAFVRGLGAGHREALFAARPLLVEGPSDEIVVDALDDALGVHVYASGGDVVTAVGKGSMPTILKLLRLIGKEPAALADLDGFTDGLELVDAFNDVEAGRLAALPQASLRNAVKPAHDALGKVVASNWSDIEAQARAHPYYKVDDGAEPSVKVQRRAAAAVLLSADEHDVASWTNGTEVWVPLRQQLESALAILESAGLYVLRRGTVEDCYTGMPDRRDKVGSAADEADQILADPSAVETRHDVAVRALRRVSPAEPVDESAAVRAAFLSVVTPAVGVLRSNPSATTADLRQVAIRHAKEASSLFEVTRADAAGGPAVGVALAASVLEVAGFPLVVNASDDPVTVAKSQIVPLARP